ncbi:AAA family ATPase [Pseudobutyrivibrio xylanivorans]|uniref:ATPase family associated with various cellular activities (AAA) n=1 Tax=Pseudobutyrivibrio xylanivorans DSM 14809 TaxID=1123012 RepID=A0A1M6DB41_PSEXY|nr:AAA family ATPase [Pseudobutyrivibrio xylanivorans]SHI70472.1 ATPase family associated with various cellular activities (AAA) [Pseudobutyrivibrio xylanivorans DSM 14809]
MKVISTGSKFDIFPDDLKTYEKLPADYYVVRFNKTEGFYLEKYYEFKMTESKIYGVHVSKVEKVIKSYKEFNRNLGIILSGDKGIGKSLFARMIGNRAVETGIPVVIVDKYIEGIGSFVDSIDQEVMILFDEFDKTFSSKNHDGPNPQSSMLSLFDGVSQGKKLFVVTCNELRGLNDFLVNRPGRFHYHFRFDYPTAKDIRIYLEDKLRPEYEKEINNVIKFSNRVALNYDCLRAIAFEINQGLPFSEAIKDLNILNIEKEKYSLQAYFMDGSMLINRCFYMNSFSNEEVTFHLKEKNGEYAGEVSFCPTDITMDYASGTMVLEAKNVSLGYDTYDDEEDAKKKNALIERGLQKIVITRVTNNQLYYAV